MLGTIVNSAVIIVGSLIGLLIKGNLKERYKQIITQSVGLSIIFVGAGGTLKNMLLLESNPILFIVSLVIGGLVGTLLDIEGALKRLGDYLEAKAGGGESSISRAFVAGSLLFCVGTMAILGSLESGIQGVHSTLYAKSVLDGVMSVIICSTMGIGVIFSAVSVFIYQGTLTMLAGFIEPYLSPDMIREISIIGGILITGLGLDVLEIKKVNVSNMLPAVLVPVIYYMIVG